MAMIAWEKVTLDEHKIISKIAKRAHKMGLMGSDFLSLTMDIQATHIDTPLRLKDLLKADDFNFTHDICGIQRHMNRETGKLENFFLPRFSA
jgi:hypothetical protein